MPLSGNSDATPSSENSHIHQMERSIAREAREDQRHLDNTIKTLSGAEETHDKSVNAALDSQSAVDKASENEYQSARALNRANHDHNTAISDEQDAQKTAKIHQMHEARLGQDLQQKRTHLDEQMQRKAENDQARESRLSQIHAQAAASAATYLDDDAQRITQSSVTTATEADAPNSASAGDGRH